MIVWSQPADEEVDIDFPLCERAEYKRVSLQDGLLRWQSLFAVAIV